MKQTFPISNYTIGNITNATTGKKLDVYIDGAIVDADTEEFLREYFGDTTSTSYKSFRNSIEQVSPTELNVYCSGPGGSVADALAMHDYLQALQAKGTKVTVTNRGMVASALTFMFLAVPKENRFVSANSFILIHNVSGGVVGTLQEMRSYLEFCEKVNDNAVNMYVSNSTLSQTKVVNMMEAETIMFPQEMESYGFVAKENIVGGVTLTNKVDLHKLGIKNKAVYNTYNSFFNDNQNDMDAIQAIKDGFSELKNEFKTLFNKKPENGEVVDIAPLVNKLDGMNTAITNALEAQNATINNLLSGEAFATAVDARLTNLATTETVATKEELEAFKTDVAGKLGNKSKTEPIEEDETRPKNQKYGPAPKQTVAK